MSFGLKYAVRAATVGVLFSMFTSPAGVFAQDHVVSSSDMRKAVVDATQTRQQNLDALNRFFSSEEAQKALELSHMDAQRVKTATATLDDQELAQLATRANKAQQDFAAGNMSDHDLLVILIAIAALILIIIAVR